MEDLIRRSDAIANIEILLDDISDIQDEDELKEIKAYNLGVWASLNSIKHHVPSTGRSQGKWIRRDYWSEGAGMGESYGFYYECSNCGEQQKGGYSNCGMKYCPDCGARMKGADNE